MKIDMYRCKFNADKMISVPAGSDITKLKFPKDIDSHYLNLVQLQKNLEIVAGQQYFLMSADEIINDINSKGYALHGIKTTVHER